MSLSTHALQHLLDTWGYVAVLAFVAVESTGIPFPGETMLVTAAAYAGSGHLHIPLVIMAAAAGAIAGDNLGFLVGHWGGRSVALRYGKYIRLDASKLDTAERFFARHGDKTVFLGRFIAVLRAWAAFLAGMNRMPWHKFLVFNAAGGICWSILYGVLGFELGKNLALLDRVRQIVGIGGLVVVVLVAIVALVLHRRARRLVKSATSSTPAGVEPRTTTASQAPDRADSA